ncbi:hypothetical protein C7H85_07355 [Zobellella endophytica]|uniref:Uncharacterized protein n=1 Tax=Zobellella endophytica TaxID=2116700 RepID=A0A2P7R8A0_9GAMM|nr:hypothetical protein C7H85_07355 [Zobellella endophytica]
MLRQQPLALGGILLLLQRRHLVAHGLHSLLHHAHLLLPLHHGGGIDRLDRFGGGVVGFFGQRRRQVQHQAQAGGDKDMFAHGDIPLGV